MERHVVSEKTDISEVRTASIITAMIMEAVRTSETSVYSETTLGATFQKALIFILAAVRTWNLEFYAVNFLWVG